MREATMRIELRKEFKGRGTRVFYNRLLRNQKIHTFYFTLFKMNIFKDYSFLLIECCEYKKLFILLYRFRRIFESNARILSAF